jgi:UTP:GlnB (protein PII) uridylyltransferase
MDAMRPFATSSFGGMSSTKVRFVESESGVLSLLEIETSRRRALFPKIAAALFVLRVQIVRAESRVSRGARVERLSVVELDGAPISTRRRLEIQNEILTAIDSGEVVPRRAYLTASRY